MRHRIDPLIKERAPWLFKDGIAHRAARSVLNRGLSYDETVKVATQLQGLDTADIMAAMFQRIGKEVSVSGLENLPRQGAALIVANHPTGIADGIMLHGLIAQMRPDAYFFANKDILRVMPQMENMIAPVEWRKDQRSHGKTRETMSYLRKAVAEDRLGVIFPSGRLAKRRGLRLFERPWMGSAAMLARKFKLPVIPVNIRARNSAMFYLFDLIHPTLRDVTLFHETLNKAKQPYSVTIGEAISPSALPDKTEDGIALLRKATLDLGDETGAQTVSLVKTSRRLLWS
ncbi:lysophospholipid acyltransferase family protein [Octadecabacter sp. CECT 8868]|uniref:lysophospholipid acyltransferase family protein n=1 Tax=Octadecabacter algicola TaxID=2909342 RepID=UPI001F2F4590|nr:lysophospholipid acyltransferase family protein [Octadecabacter algicola]MCF2904322.1 lysophospholipid acyltransferase family protein [Octadecabacter algicola]